MNKLTSLKVEDPLIKYRAFSTNCLTEEQIKTHLKHHKKYYDTTVKILDHPLFKDWSLEQLLSLSGHSLYNNAAQYYYHNMYWDNLIESNNLEDCSLKTLKNKTLGQNLEKIYNTEEALKKEFIEKSMAHFGSGWFVISVDLKDPSELEFKTYLNAQLPIKENKIAILVIDLWEHAYYVNYKNDKLAYLNSVWDELNWCVINNRYQNHKTDYCKYPF